MKVSLENKHDNVRNVSFKGFKPVKSDEGFKNYEFSYVFDENRDDCYLEVFKLGKDRNNNYFPEGKLYARNGSDRYRMKSGSNRIDMSKMFGIDDNVPFAYHYVLKNKNNNNEEVMVDAGDIINFKHNNNDDSSIFNIVMPTKSNMSRGGNMKLVIIDSQKVGYVYNDQNQIVKDERVLQRAQKGIKTIANKFGGTLAGLEKAVEDGEYDAYNRIISLPVFTDDDFTAHAYWNKNCMQMASSLGNINNYASLQRKMFAHGLNFVSDGAFVNEGLQGVHFKHMLKWGDESPYFNWFKAQALNDGPLSLGVFVKNKKYISHKVVNSPYRYVQNPNSGKVSIKNNPNFDKTKPTYIQYFDTRLVTDEERNDNKSLIKTYAKMSTDNVFDLHTHNDSVYLYSFEIDPKTYNENVKRLNEYNASLPKDERVSLESPMAARILSKFRYADVDGKFESGFETWDANPDIAKLNFVYSHADTKALKNVPSAERKQRIREILNSNCQVQDYAVTSGQYWTQKTDDILRLAVARELKNIDTSNPSLVFDTIVSKSNGQVFPKTLKHEVSKDEVENVLFDLYNHKRELSNEDKKSQILKGLMNTPLDSFEFGDNLVAVLASPLITKRASVPSEIGVSRYELFKSGDKNLLPQYKLSYEKMNELYTNELSVYAEKVLKTVEEKSNGAIKFFDEDNVTEFGKYVLPLVMPEITKYAFVKTLAPNVKISVDKNSGEISYDYKALKDITLESLNITNPSSPQDEADMLISKLRKGVQTLGVSDEDKIVKSIIKTFKGTSAESFKLADLIIDKNQAGLDWRIDATKDIADIEALRNGNNDFDYTWQKVIDFWQKFNHGVISKNPNAYTVAEITDEGSLYDLGYGNRSEKFGAKYDIISKFQRETGMTSTANYSFFFNDIPKLFAKQFEDGASLGTDNNKRQWMLYDIMMSPGNYLKSASLDSIMYSYMFIGNHDKPRALHSMAMDMGMFYTDLTYPDNYDNRFKAYQLIKDKFMDYIDPQEVNNYDFSAVSPKAMAMGLALRRSFISVLEKYKQDNRLSDAQFTRAFEAVSKSVSDLSQGKFEGKRFDPDAFGIKPFDVTIAMVLKHAKDRYHLDLPQDLAEKFEGDVFEFTLEPAITKLLGAMKYLVALPGMPTMFDGDDMGATGYDSKTKNMYLQGRQRIHDEWSDKYKNFIGKHKQELDMVMAVRRKPECNALNNGAPFMLPPQHANSGEICPAILRKSTDGRMAISIFNTSGLHDNFEAKYNQNTLVLDSLNLNFEAIPRENRENEIIMMHGKDVGAGITGLKHDTVFVNANDPNDFYYVNECDGKYVIKRGTDGGRITINDSTLILYHVPKGTPLSFTGNLDVKLPVKFVTNVYSNKCSEDCGTKLALLK
ncbi:hypothetical protein HDR58_09435 [bacterium]|nr:hypothetical protein [bacterium]